MSDREWTFNTELDASINAAIRAVAERAARAAIEACAEYVATHKVAWSSNYPHHIVIEWQDKDTEVISNAVRAIDLAAIVAAAMQADGTEAG